MNNEKTNIVLTNLTQLWQWLGQLLHSMILKDSVMVGACKLVCLEMATEGFYEIRKQLFTQPICMKVCFV